MAAEGKPVIMSRLVRRDEADRDFPIELWQRAGHDAIFKAAWELAETTVLIQGGDRNQLQLQRSVASSKAPSILVVGTARTRLSVSA